MSRRSLGVFAALNGNLLAKPRVAYAMARDGCYRLRLESPHGGGVTGAQSVERSSGRPLERRGSNHEPRRSLYLPQSGRRDLNPRPPEPHALTQGVEFRQAVAS